MHELSIAAAIVGLAERHAAGRRVTRLQVSVGHLRQVVRSALEFGFALVAEGTAVESAELLLEEVPAEARCRRCGEESRQPAFPLRCAACGALDVEVTRGEELRVDWLDVEEEEAAAVPEREGAMR